MLYEVQAIKHFFERSQIDTDLTLQRSEREKTNRAQWEKTNRGRDQVSEANRKLCATKPGP